MTHQFTAYQLQPRGFDIIPAPHGRDWMNQTHDRSAYRCLPMLIANQSGWQLLNPATVRVRWDGGPNLDAIEIQHWQPPGATQAPPGYLISHFGSGIITWTIPYLFRTTPGYNLLVRGPANMPKDGIAPLEGAVETDWTVASFTMNWKITRPDTWITFAEAEPFCLIVPQRRGELEEFTPKTLPITEDPELLNAVAAWQDSRGRFNEERKDPDSDAAKRGWEKDYFQGHAAPQHQTKLHLHPFTGGPD